MRRLIQLTVALIMAVTVLSVWQAPANAYVTGKKCISYRDIVTCIEPQWRRQDDGSGVRVEGVWLDTTRGCSSLESGWPQYDDVKAVVSNPPSETPVSQINLGGENCNNYHDLELKGPDTGPVYFMWTGKARIDLAGDRWVHFKFYLEADGAFSLVSAYTTEA